MKYYKVVHKHNDGFYYSAMYTEMMMLEVYDLITGYPVGQWVEADPVALSYGYGLCVFTSLETAREFVEFSPSSVFECEVGSVLEYLPRWGYTDVQLKIRYPDDDPMPTPPEIRHNAWPRDTVMVSKVKLIKEV